MSDKLEAWLTKVEKDPGENDIYPLVRLVRAYREATNRVWINPDDVNAINDLWDALPDVETSDG